MKSLRLPWNKNDTNAGSEGIYYFLGNISSHLSHALPLFKKLGGTFIVLSQEPYEYLGGLGLPVLMLDDRPDLFLEFSPRQIPKTLEYINANAKVVIFYEVFSISENIRPPQIMLTHGLSFKDYYIDWRQKIIPFYTRIAGLGPDWRRKTVKAGAKECQILDVGLARADDIIKIKGRIKHQRRLSKELRLNPRKKFITYMPTWWGETSVEELGLQLIFNMSEEYNLIFRPHPATPKEIISRYVHLIETEKLNATYVPEGRYENIDLQLVYEASTAFIGDLSSVMLDAVLTDKPILFAFNKDLRAHSRMYSPIREVFSSNSHVTLRNVSQINDLLAEAVAKGIDKNAYQLSKARTFFGLEGQNIEKIIAAIKSAAHDYENESTPV